MERLQAAIEKARAQRGDGPAEAGAPVRPGAMTPPGPKPGLAETWAALRPLDTSATTYSQPDVLVAFRAGGYATPYDMLRTRVLQQANANGWKRIAIVSPHSGSGKTTTLANLAFSLGRQTDLRTMVIDFDLRRATLAKVLAQDPEHSMADVIEGRVPFAEHAYGYNGNLAFGLNGSHTALPAELLHSQRARLAIEAIEAEYAPDLMFFDLPPLLAADDSFGFLRSVDCALIVVAAEETPMSQIDVTERHVAELTQVMGVVLNKCRLMGEAYGYDYGSY